jgi:hypothetical protein
VDTQTKSTNLEAPGRNGMAPTKGLLPNTWIGRGVRLEYVDAYESAQETSGVLLDLCPVGPILSLGGQRRASHGIGWCLSSWWRIDVQNMHALRRRRGIAAAESAMASMGYPPFHEVFTAYRCMGLPQLHGVARRVSRQTEKLHKEVTQ